MTHASIYLIPPCSCSCPPFVPQGRRSGVNWQIKCILRWKKNVLVLLQCTIRDVLLLSTFTLVKKKILIYNCRCMHKRLTLAFVLSHILMILVLLTLAFHRAEDEVMLINNNKKRNNWLDYVPSRPVTALRIFFLHFRHDISTLRTVLCTIADRATELDYSLSLWNLARGIHASLAIIIFQLGIDYQFLWNFGLLTFLALCSSARAGLCPTIVLSIYFFFWQCCFFYIDPN